MENISTCACIWMRAEDPFSQIRLLYLLDLCRTLGLCRIAVLFEGFILVSGNNARPVPRIFGGGVLFQKKWTLFK